MKRPSGWQWRSAHSGGARRTQARAAVRATDGAPPGRGAARPQSESDSVGVGEHDSDDSDSMTVIMLTRRLGLGGRRLVSEAVGFKTPVEPGARSRSRFRRGPSPWQPEPGGAAPGPASAPSLPLGCVRLGVDDSRPRARLRRSPGEPPTQQGSLKVIPKMSEESKLVKFALVHNQVKVM